MGSYHATQTLPEDFVREPELVANVIAGRVEYLLGRVIADGRHPFNGELTVRPYEGVDRTLIFSWHEDE